MSGRVNNGLFVDYCAKDFLDGTLNLDPWEELAYRRVVDMIYATNDRLPDDDKKLAWSTKAGSRWTKIKAVLIAAGKIEVIDGRISNRRCRAELEKSARKISQRSDAGKASAVSRNHLNNNESQSTDVPTEPPTKPQLTTKLPTHTKNPSGFLGEDARGGSAVDGAKKPRSPRGTRLPAGWAPSDEDTAWAIDEGLSAERVEREAARFRDFWHGKAGQGAMKVDWSATWRNWIRKTVDGDQNGNRCSNRRGGFAALAQREFEGTHRRT